MYQIILQFNTFAAAFLCTIRTQSLLLIALAAWPALAQLSQPLAARALLSGHAAGKSAWRASSRLLASPHRAPTSSAATLAASLPRRRRGESLPPPSRCGDAAEKGNWTFTLPPSLLARGVSYGGRRVLQPRRQALPRPAPRRPPPRPRP